MRIEGPTQAGVTPVEIDVAAEMPTRRRGRTRASRLFREQVPVVGSGILVLVAWEFLGRTMDYYALPPFSDVIQSLWTMLQDGTLIGAMGSSMVILAVGLAIAIPGGILIGTLMGVSRHVSWALDIYVNGAMVAPMIAFVPVFVIVFGLGYQPRLATVILYSIFPVIVNTEAGIRNADRSLLEMGHSFGATPSQLFWRVRLPDAMVFIKGGLLIASSRGVKGLISGEVLIAVVGLGGLIHKYGSAFSMTQLYGLIIFLIVLALTLRILVDRVITALMSFMASPR